MNDEELKAILILDMPSSCEECKYNTSYYQIDDICSADKTMCPLKPLPQKKDTHGRYIENQYIETAYEVGWNDCVDELGGKEE